MSAPASFEVAESTRLDPLLLVARHLRRHPLLPEPHRMTVDRVWQRLRLHLLNEPDKELRDLLTWHDSLRLSLADVWRTACGTRLVANVLGRTDDGLPVECSPAWITTRTCSRRRLSGTAGGRWTRPSWSVCGPSACGGPPGKASCVGTVVGGLTEAQADGLACVICGADYLRVRLAYVPVGRSATGSQVFACAGRCTAFARTEYPAGGDVR